MEEAREKAFRLVDRMRSSFGDAIVTNWEGLEGTYGLPDPDDERCGMLRTGSPLQATLTLSRLSQRLPRQS